MKQCTVCKDKKDVMAFYSLADSNQDFTAICRECKSEGHKEPIHIQAERKDSETSTRSRYPEVRQAWRRRA